ncbi:MAG: DUF4177 domain-containing protein [Desulfuromonadales bacterium]|nr:DUF4177 domain-containing protein [Desulfuromonadales bacterium]
MLIYKVVELSVVTDESLETALNETTALGWQFDSIQFVMREASRRPAMAFVLFVREQSPDEEALDKQAANPPSSLHP